MNEYDVPLLSVKSVLIIKVQTVTNAFLAQHDILASFRNIDAGSSTTIFLDVMSHATVISLQNTGNTL